MFSSPVSITILLTAPATGKAVKIPAAEGWLAPLLFDKDQFNAYLQRGSRPLQSGKVDFILVTSISIYIVWTLISYG